MALALALLCYYFTAHKRKNPAGALALLTAVFAAAGFFAEMFLNDAEASHQTTGAGFWMTFVVIIFLVTFGLDIMGRKILAKREKGEEWNLCQWIPKHLKRWENVLFIVVVFFFILIQFSPPFSDKLSLVHFGVTDGKINGTLSLGTYGYCLYLPNKHCPPSHFLYKIGQFKFFFQPSHFITSSYLL